MEYLFHCELRRFTLISSSISSENPSIISGIAQIDRWGSIAASMQTIRQISSNPLGSGGKSPYQASNCQYSRLSLSQPARKFSISIRYWQAREHTEGRINWKISLDHAIGIDISALLKSLQRSVAISPQLWEKKFSSEIVFHTAFRQRLGVIIFMKSRFVRFLVNALLRIILPVYENFSLIITKGFEICYRYEMMAFLFHAAISTKT